MKKALIVQGGWEGHSPAQTAEFMAALLRARGFEVTISDTLDAFKTADLTALDLIVPNWTMGEIAPEQLKPLLDAVRGGVGLGGIHGGMGDAFRASPDYQFMVGGQWVAHPGNDGVTYTVHVDGEPSPITDGIRDFSVTSELYYMHVDPGNTVLATTRYEGVRMPVAWTKRFGQGRVFYLSLGHRLNVIEPDEPRTILQRGLVWAAEGTPSPV